MLLCRWSAPTCETNKKCESPGVSSAQLRILVDDLQRGPLIAVEAHGPNIVDEGGEEQVCEGGDCTPGMDSNLGREDTPGGSEDNEVGPWTPFEVCENEEGESNDWSDESAEWVVCCRDGFGQSGGVPCWGKGLEEANRDRCSCCCAPSSC